jgi:two-component sensor histidine kinase
MIADKHPSEAARVAALRRYDVLGSPREADFDQIVALAAQICGTPISVVNLIDADRQWFKAEVGLGVRETPLDTSLCAHVILEDSFVEIPDTLSDSRMADNPLCTGDGGLRFYAGALLKSVDGYPIGTLCVLDNQPRQLTDLQRETLRVLAAQVMTQLDLRAVIATERTLRHEIDHRVKNSLQSVGSFVALERGATTNVEAIAVLDSVARQIHTVALLHQHIGTGEGDHAIALDTYLDRVVQLLDRTTSAEIEIVATFDPAEVDAKQASSLAVIVNELTANAVKHAFRQNGGHIEIRGRLANDGTYQLTFRDDGQAIETPQPTRREGLGLSIIRASVAQLGGTLTSERSDAGYRTQINVRLDKALD